MCRCGVLLSHAFTIVLYQNRALLQKRPTNIVFCHKRDVRLYGVIEMCLSDVLLPNALRWLLSSIYQCVYTNAFIFIYMFVCVCVCVYVYVCVCVGVGVGVGVGVCVCVCVCVCVRV